MTFSDALLATADDCGQVPYATALHAARLHSAGDLFIDIYGSALNWVDCGVDAGELLAWLGY